MKKILYIADIFGPNFIKIRKPKNNLSFAGSAKVLSIASALKYYGHDLIIYSYGSISNNSFKFYSSFDETILDQDKNNIKIHYGFTFDNKYLRLILSYLSALIFIPKIIYENSINIIIIYNLTTINLIILLIGKLFNLKIILQYEDGATLSREMGRSKIKSVFYFFEIIAKKLADGIFGPTKKLILRKYKAKVIPGILGDDLLVKKKVKNTNTNSLNNSIKIIYAGGFDKSKGIDLFLKAINHINFKIEMIVTGNGPILPEIKKLCVHNRHSVKFCQSVSRKKLIKYLNWADVGINPHLNIHEGGAMPFKIIEYLGTCGTVFSNSLDGMPKKLKSKVYLYKGENLTDISIGFKLFLKKWPKLKKTSESRIMWTRKNYSKKKIGKELLNLF